MKKIIWFSSILCFLTAIIVLSCQKTGDSPAKLEEDVAAVKLWFENEIQTKFSDDELTLNARGQSRTIVWNQAIHFQDGGDEIFQVPFKSKSSTSYLFASDTAHVKIPLSVKEENNVRYLVISKRKDGPTDFALMTIIPSKSYNKSVKGNLEGNNYRNLKPGFEGQVLFHNWRGDFKNGWSYVAGEITGEIRNTKWQKYDPEAKTSNTCTTVTVYELCQTCTDWTFSNGEYTYSNCTEPTVCGSTSTTTCTTDSPPSGGGGGGGSYNNWGGITGYATLCGANLFKFKFIAEENAWVGNLTGFNSRFAKWGPGTLNPTVLYVPIAELCVTIPVHQTNLTELGASEKFKTAFNRVYNETVDALNGGLPPTVNGVKVFMVTELEAWLSAGFPGAKVRLGTCSGPYIPYSEAKYQQDCN